MDDITLTIGGVVYDCIPRVAPVPGIVPWALPVSDGNYPPKRWYCATWHDPTGKRNSGYKHTGIDLNLDVAPWGDIERRSNLGVFSVSDGAVHFVTDDWYGAPMAVVRHEHKGQWLYVRYGHITPVIAVGDIVSRHQRLGGFANWRGGDHLHFDMSRTAYTTEWFTPGMLDPVPVLKAHHDPAIVDAMLRKGD